MNIPLSRALRATRVLVISVVCLTIDTACAADLQIAMQNFKNGSGHAILRLFAAPEGFPKDSSKALRSIKVAIDAGQAAAAFSDLPPGEYAVAVAHDENDSGDLDFGMLGIPKEGIGFTRDAPATLGPPNFDAAKIRLDTESRSEVIRMRY